MNGVSYERPGANVVFVRSFFYGIGAGGAFGIIVGLLATRSVYSIPVSGGWGAIIGGFTGLILGLILVMFRPTASLRTRAIVSIVAMFASFMGVSLLLQGFPFHPSILLLITPAGIAAWFMLPMVLRPETRGRMPRLPGHST